MRCPIRPKLVRHCAIALALLAPACLLMAPVASADPVRLIAERNVQQATGNLFLITYPSVTDMVNGTGFAQQSIGLGNSGGIMLSDEFDIAGFSTDGNGVVRLIAERQVQQATGNLFLITYPSVADMVTGTGFAQQSISLGNSGGIMLTDEFDIAGLTIDSSGAVRLIAERRVQQATGNLFLITYASVTDLVNGTGFAQQSIGLGNSGGIMLSDEFDIADFSIDESGAFRLIAERNVQQATSNLFQITYPSLADLVNGTGFAQQSIGLGNSGGIMLSDEFNIAGFDIELRAATAVDEPQGMALLLGGLACAVFAGRTARKASVAPRSASNFR
jgi:hypothetical protein